MYTILTNPTLLVTKRTVHTISTKSGWSPDECSLSMNKTQTCTRLLLVNLCRSGGSATFGALASATAVPSFGSFAAQPQTQGFVGDVSSTFGGGFGAGSQQS